ncbi:MAG: dUTP diphosphatase [Spirochaetes bacterium]|nr:dUTP diphosphatase [Spirochaetota bacterium]
MKVRFKKLSENAITPMKAYKGDACFDLYASWVAVNVAKEYIKYGTGIAIEIPEGYVGLVFPRSSIVNTPFILKNSVGVIDSGYRGEITVVFTNVKTIDPLRGYREGERIAQILILPIPEVELEEVDELSPSERGTNGYGSSGLK